MIFNRIKSALRPALRFLAALLVFCMISTVLPTGMTAHAATYNLWVGGSRVTSDNASSLLSGKASYNASTNTLTLNGASITKGISVYDSEASAAIYTTGALNIVLNGNNTVSLSGYAIAVDGALSISGGGTLTVTTTGDMFSSIYSGGKTTISGGTVTLRASGNESIGLWSYGGLTVSGGSLAASASGNSACGVLSDAAVTINSGSLTANASGSEAWGIAAFGKLTVNGGSLKAVATGTNTTGVYASSMTLSTGSFEVSGAECAVYLDNASSISTASGYSLREGSASPGSVVSSFTNSSSVSGTFMSKPSVSASQSTDTEVVRLGGGSRYETAIVISSNGWKSANTVVLVNAFSFADALAGVPLAYALDAPILLVNGETIDSSVMNQISALGAKNAYLLGGTLAISAAAEKQLTDNGIKTTRVYGTSRYDTAIAIAKKLTELSGKKPASVIFANGFNYPDALAVSSAAAISGTPILYAPTTGKIDDNTASYLDSAGISSAVVLGGELAIDAGVYSSIKSHVSSIERVYGTSRYDTAVKIIDRYSSLFTGSGIAVATGTNYPDALAGAAFAAKKGVAVMLVPATLASGSAQATTLKGLITSKVATVYVFGGTGAVSDSVITELLK